MNQLTEHLFRNFYQEVFASLVIKFGNQHIDTIEDALQETFYKAVKSWKFNKFPEKPKDWLFIVTRNNVINELKRTSKWIRTDFESIDYNELALDTLSAQDDQLQLLVACSRFDIEAKAKLIFTLKAICGFGVSEIAHSLLVTEDNIYKIVQRVKKKLKSLPKNYFQNASHKPISYHDADYLEQIIYFMFNEGYDSINKSSSKALNRDICFEALRLAHLLEDRTMKASVKNLLALFYFLMARFDSRVGAMGEFISLRKQDRSKWDLELIQLGFKYLTKPNDLNRFYIEALIASLHSTSPFFSATNWKEILKLYDTLLLIHDTSIVRLNRAICLYELGDKKAGKVALDELKDELEDSYIYFSVSMAEYLADKDKELSKLWYQKSLEVTKQPFRKELIQQKMKGVN